MKTGAKVGRHGRYVTFQLAQAAAPRELVREILWLPVVLPAVYPAVYNDRRFGRYLGNVGPYGF